MVVLILGPLATEKPSAEVDRFVVLTLPPVANTNPTCPVDRFTVLTENPVANANRDVPELSVFTFATSPKRLLTVAQERVALPPYKVDVYRVLKVEIRG